MVIEFFFFKIPRTYTTNQPR